jgi:Tfp pilus assembly protein PilO
MEPFKDTESIATKIDIISAKIVKEEQRKAQIPAKEEELKKLTAQQDAANQLLPKESDPAQLVAFINAKAQEVGVDIGSLTPKAAKKKSSGGFRGRIGGAAAGSGDKFEEWVYAIELNGSYDKIAMFINRMEEFEIVNGEGQREKRFFAVRDIDITADKLGVKEENVKHIAKVTMVTYRYKGGELAAGPVRPGAPARPVR